MKNVFYGRVNTAKTISMMTVVQKVTSISQMSRPSTFRLGNGKEFIVTWENVGKDNIYVQNAAWQGKEYNSFKMTHSRILEGGELHFVMGDKPSDRAKK